ncbi:Bromodomain-containing protein 8 [Mortierella sp. GBA43]|nr:Bromodomain-containing protein 8 [Mortierella sp. GBA43]
MSDPSSTEIKSDSEPWSVLENLVLVQAIYKCGDTNWVAIARTIKGHPQIHRSSNFFSQKNCAIQYTLLMENLKAETRSKQSRSNEAGTSVTQVKLAGQLYNQRILEIKAMIRKDEERFRALVAELDEIRQGKWDSQLAEELKKNPSLALDTEEGTTDVVGSSADSNQQQSEADNPLLDTTAPSSLSTPSSTSLSDKQEDVNRTGDTGADQSTVAVSEGQAGSSEIDSANHTMDMDMDVEDVLASTTQTPTESKDVSHTPAAGSEDIEMEDVFSKDPLPAADLDSSAPNMSQESTEHPEEIQQDTKPVSEPEPGIDSPITAADTPTLEAMEDVTPANDNSENLEGETDDDVHVDRIEADDNDLNDEIKEIKSEEESKENLDEESDADALQTAEDPTEEEPDVDEEEEESKVDEKPKIKSEDTPIDTTHHEETSHEGGDDGATSVDEEEIPSTPKSGGRRSRKSRSTIPAKRKRRPTRGGSGGGDQEESDSSDSETVDSAHTSMSDQPRTIIDDKKWRKILMMIWSDIANHRFGAVFMQPIKEQDAPGYYYMIKRPMDLKSIKERIRDGQITNADEFHRDVLLMFMNALMYNSEDTEVYQMALAMMTEVEIIIKNFKSSQSFAPAGAGATGSGSTSSSLTPTTRTSGSELPSPGSSQPATRKKKSSGLEMTPVE